MIKIVKITNEKKENETEEKTERNQKFTRSWTFIMWHAFELTVQQQCVCHLCCTSNCQPEHTERKDESRVERVKRIMPEANRSVCLCSRRTSVSANARQWHILTHTRTHARNQSCQKNGNNRLRNRCNAMQTWCTFRHSHCRFTTGKED